MRHLFIVRLNCFVAALPQMMIIHFCIILHKLDCYLCRLKLPLANSIAVTSQCRFTVILLRRRSDLRSSISNQNNRHVWRLFCCKLVLGYSTTLAIFDCTGGGIFLCTRFVHFSQHGGRVPQASTPGSIQCLALLTQLCSRRRASGYWCL